MNKKTFSYLILFCFLLSIPIISLAGDYIVNGRDVHFEGLVPCGKAREAVEEQNAAEPDPDKKETLSSGSRPGVDMPCNFCHIFIMLSEILRFGITYIVPPIAILLIAWGGIQIFLAGGNPALVKKGVEIIQWVAIGIAVILGAWIIVNTFFMFIGVADWTGLRQGWFKIDCGDFGTPRKGCNYEFEDDCKESGCYWYDDSCHDTREIVPPPPPEPEECPEDCLGGRRCIDSTHFQTCALSEGNRVWLPMEGQECLGGTWCRGAPCVIETGCGLGEPCVIRGQRRCAQSPGMDPWPFNTAREECTLVEGELIWNSTIACHNGYCRNGACVLGDPCESPGTEKCVDANHFHVCRSDYFWGNEIDCSDIGEPTCHQKTENEIECIPN